MDSIEGYCLKCKEKRVMVNPQAEWAANGSPATRGVCPVCGTNIYLRGRTPAHDTLPKPEATVSTSTNGQKKPGGKTATSGKKKATTSKAASKSKGLVRIYKALASANKSFTANKSMNCNAKMTMSGAKSIPPIKVGT